MLLIPNANNESKQQKYQNRHEIIKLWNLILMILIIPNSDSKY